MQGSFAPSHLAAVPRALTPRSRLALNGDGTVNHEQSEFLYTYQISMQVRPAARAFLRIRSHCHTAPQDGAAWP